MCVCYKSQCYFLSSTVLNGDKLITIRKIVIKNLVIFSYGFNNVLYYKMT